MASVCNRPGPSLAALALLVALIHASAWKRILGKFAVARSRKGDGTLGHRGGAKHGFESLFAGACRIRGEESLLAVATCNGLTSREF
jgi:hypothetical protein